MDYKWKQRCKTLKIDQMTHLSMEKVHRNKAETKARKMTTQYLQNTQQVGSAFAFFISAVFLFVLNLET